MKIEVHNNSGIVVDSIDIDSNVFGVKLNPSVVRQAVLAELTNLRQGTHSAKNRSAVRGGGKKPFKQKGRGVARAGTIRSPLWKGGGVVFGPEPHGYSHKMPKKMSKLARKSVISKRIKDGEVVVLDTIDIESKKTSNFKSFLKNIKVGQKKTLILVSSFQENLVLASRNIRNVFIENARSVSVYDLLDSEVILIDKIGVKILSEVLA
ncbi:50S ribosomal protein L4 [bacterium]|jgi:large subunit ribosomal protein L4|nr:50S ribosomal protein L4 [bacterium]MBT4249669.1 50S ribosomal protein L4 [bacterium]MBT4926622.1 50S ribosomal protein L4 [bacterium]MBT5733820.1 50S ribosomal protein L4 [bacterium]MBT6019296.1 50S ribosomal protein L4 [bacterium]